MAKIIADMMLFFMAGNSFAERQRCATEVNGAGPALAGTVTFTGVGTIALLGSVFISF